MSVWDTYPADYRAEEVKAILNAVSAGECVSLIGLSGSGKSNLLGFIANRVSSTVSEKGMHFVLVDCNRLKELNSDVLFNALRRALGDQSDAVDELDALEGEVVRRLGESPGVICVIFDRFDAFDQTTDPSLYNNLRSLRDSFKYELAYVLATRRPLDPHTELTELFYGNTIWLGPLSESDACWSVERFVQRKRQKWEKEVVDRIIELSWAYPALLRALCEAYADVSELNEGKLVSHPAVLRRVSEFWVDGPDEDALSKSRLKGQPLLMAGRAPGFDTSTLTAKEHALLEFFTAHPNEVCEKDELIKAVWPEDVIYEDGVRDDSLAQLVRRLRKKIEPDPKATRYIKTVPGRGYRFEPL
jgi:energy-coupling factor transporter ATP-binding protein EcfA2